MEGKYPMYYSWSIDIMKIVHNILLIQENYNKKLNIKSFERL